MPFQTKTKKGFCINNHMDNLQDFIENADFELILHHTFFTALKKLHGKKQTIRRFFCP